MPPYDFSNPIKTVHTLPAGEKTGILLHKLIEILPLNKLRLAKNAEQLIPFFDLRVFLQKRDTSEFAFLVVFQVSY